MGSLRKNHAPNPIQTSTIPFLTRKAELITNSPLGRDIIHLQDHHKYIVKSDARQCCCTGPSKVCHIISGSIEFHDRECQRSQLMLSGQALWRDRGGIMHFAEPVDFFFNPL